MRDSDQLMELFGTTRPSEATRTEYRRKAKASTYFMGTLLGFHDLTVGCHGAMASWIQSPGNRKLGLAPRDHLKTSVWTIADSLREVVCNPNIRILIENETAPNVQNFLARIKSVFERNAVFRWCFPELIPNFSKARWTQNAIEVPRSEDYPEATIEVMGVGGASTSRHYNLIKEDDLVGREAGESQAVMQKAIDQHKLAESLLNDPHDRIQSYGTRWAPFDLVDWMLKHERNLDCFILEVLHPPDHPKAGRPIWPERFSAAHIEDLRVKLGPKMFNLQYRNRALAEGVTEFDRNWLNHWHAGEDDTFILERPESAGGPVAYTLDDLYCFQLIDPCFSPENGYARAADIIVGLTPDDPFNVVLLHANAKKYTPKRIIDEAYDASRRFNVITSGIEIVGGQVAFYYWIPTVYPHMPIMKLKTDTHTRKFSRIRQTCAPLGQQGRIYVHRSMADFIEEWESFPHGQTCDLLDALAYGPQIWSPPDADSTRPRHPADEGEDEEDSTLALDGRSPITGY